MSVAAPKAPKYVYTPLAQLQGGTVANVYGVVSYFKLPYRSKGTDVCSVATVVDQSDTRLRCTFFSASQDTLPKIYKVGDIVRFHRIKIQPFNGELTAINGIGFSALVFDGIPGSPLLPRTSSKSYSFTEEDQATVESLRNWQMGQGMGSRARPRLKLSDVQPGQYFDLICQLIGKAKLDKASYLLKVWDGTRCTLPKWKVVVEDDALEGDRDFISRFQHLSIDVLVYDNHVDAATSLKVGSYIVIQNVHSKFNNPADSEAQPSYLEFHLHGGTSFARGIIELSESHADVEELKNFLDTVDLSESASLDLSPLHLSSSSDFELVLPAHQEWATTPLATVIKSRAPQKLRVRAQLRRFQPRDLYQSVKLHCTKCNSLKDIEDEEKLNRLFQGNNIISPNTSVRNTSWYQSVMWRRSPEERNVTIHFAQQHDLLQNPEDSLILVEGGTFNEICKLSRTFHSIIPVKSKQAKLELDLAAPFLIQGNRWHYGCIKCSRLKPIDVLGSLPQDGPWNATQIANALGIEPLIERFLMVFTLEDGTGSLNAFLWRHAEQFFQIPASDIFMDNQLQEKLQGLMTTLCPPEKPIGDYPWMDCCIKAYNSTDGGKEQVSYEIFDTRVSLSPN